MLKRTWISISNLGIERGAHDPETRRLRLTNQFVIISLLFSALYAISCYVAGMTRAFYVELFSVPVLFLMQLMSKAGRIKLTRYLFVLFINFQVFFLSQFFGLRSEFHLIFIPVAVIPLIVFGIRNMTRLALLSGLSVALFISLFVIGDSLAEIAAESIPPYLEMCAVITGMLSELIVIYAFIYSSQRIEQRMDDSNSLLQRELAAIFDHSQDALFLVDGVSKKIIKANRRAVEVFEMDSERDFYNTEGHRLHKNDMPADQRAGMEHALGTKGTYEAEILYLTKKGNEFWGALAISMITIQGASYQSVRVTDIHTQKLARETTRAALQEKEVLLAEIHHRVKNNMAVISALLGLQSGYTEDEKAKQLFEESRNRIHTMALIHEKLYKHDSLSKIEFGLYIHDLVAHIERSHFIDTRIRFSVLCTDVFLDIKTAVPCGLILNELVTNACKHAFKGRKEGKIRIDCIHMDTRILLQVSDNGIGTAALQSSDSKGLGMTLIQGLVEQLNGEMSISSANGTRYSIWFEAPNV